MQQEILNQFGPVSHSSYKIFLFSLLLSYSDLGDIMNLTLFKTVHFPSHDDNRFFYVSAIIPPALHSIMSSFLIICTIAGNDPDPSLYTQLRGIFHFLLTTYYH